jgi:hypothetical protein
VFQILGDAEGSSVLDDDLPVAAAAEESPHPTRVVAMVDVAGMDRELLTTEAEGARPPCRFQNGRYLSGRSR